MSGTSGENVMIDMVSVKGNIYINVNSLDKMYDYFLKRTLEIPEEVLIENDQSEDFIEGYASAMDFLKAQIKKQVSYFAVESELDSVNLGKGLTKFIDVKEL